MIFTSIKFSRIIVAINRIHSRFLSLIICMVEMCREYTRESRWQKQPSELPRVGARTEGRRGRVFAFPRDTGGRIGVHVHPHCMPLFRHVSHSRGFYTDICLTRGCKWARPIYDRQSRNSAQIIQRLS